MNNKYHGSMHWHYQRARGRVIRFAKLNPDLLVSVNHANKNQTLQLIATCYRIPGRPRSTHVNLYLRVVERTRREYFFAGGNPGGTPGFPTIDAAYAYYIMTEVEQ